MASSPTSNNYQPGFEFTTSGISKGVLIGIAIAVVVVFIAGVGFIIFCCMRRRRNRRMMPQYMPGPPNRFGNQATAPLMEMHQPNLPNAYQAYPPRQNAALPPREGFSRPPREGFSSPQTQGLTRPPRGNYVLPMGSNGSQPPSPTGSSTVARYDSSQLQQEVFEAPGNEEHPPDLAFAQQAIHGSLYQPEKDKLEPQVQVFSAVSPISSPATPALSVATAHAPPVSPLLTTSSPTQPANLGRIQSPAIMPSAPLDMDSMGPARRQQSPAYLDPPVGVVEAPDTSIPRPVAELG